MGEATAPDVSIIVCTRNRAHYLGDCLRSLAGQRSHTPYEVVVVDNGSTDGTAAVLDQWCAKDSRFRTAQEPVPGLSRAKNAGIRVARGALLLFTDDDVIADPEWVAAYRKFFSSRPRDLFVAGGPIRPVPADLSSWPRWFDEAAMVEIGLLDHGGQRALRPPEYLWGANMAMDAAVFDRCGPWDETLGRRGEQRGTFEDTELQDRVRSHGGRAWFCPGAVVQHRVPRASITPRRVMATAFTRGRNDFWRGSAAQDATDLPASRGPVAGSAILVARMMRWLGWMLSFRCFPSKRRLERSRRAAWSSGFSLDALRPGHERAFRRIALMAYAARCAVLRVVPDHP